MKSWESSSLENGLRIPDKVDGYDPDSIYFQVINANDCSCDHESSNRKKLRVKSNVI